MNKLPAVSQSIQDRYIEIHYNEKTIYTSNGDVMIRLQGKIHCPVLNSNITPMTCAKLMDSPGWPRAIDPGICEHQANCFISKSIKKNMARKAGHHAKPTKSDTGKKRISGVKNDL